MRVSPQAAVAVCVIRRALAVQQSHNPRGVMYSCVDKRFSVMGSVSFVQLTDRKTQTCMIRLTAPLS